MKQSNDKMGAELAKFRCFTLFLLATALNAKMLCFSLKKIKIYFSRVESCAQMVNMLLQSLKKRTHTSTQKRTFEAFSLSRLSFRSKNVLSNATQHTFVKKGSISKSEKTENIRSIEILSKYSYQFGLNNVQK
jgi:hypothetical protein